MEKNIDDIIIKQWMERFNLTKEELKNEVKEC